MSRAVRNIRFTGSAANKGPTAKNLSPKGKGHLTADVTKADGRAHTGDGKYENQFTPRWAGPSQILNKYDGH